MCIAACVHKKDGWEGGGCKFSLLQKLFFQCCMHNIFLGGIFTKRASGPRVISFILCGHGYCRGSQGMTPWMVNAVNFSEGRINRKTKLHLQTFPNEVKTQSRGLRRRRAADIGAGSQTRTDPHPTVHVAYGTKKKNAAFVQEKEIPKWTIQDPINSRKQETYVVKQHNGTVCLPARTVEASARVSNQRKH